MNSRRFSYLAVMLIAATYVPSVQAATIEWIRQFGTSFDDLVGGISVDENDNIFVSGYTVGIDGARRDFVAKYNASGDLAWPDLLHIFTDSSNRGVSTDRNGNAYFTGFAGFPPDDSGVYISKYSTGGNLAWTRQLDNSSFRDRSTDISADGLGNVFIAGHTRGRLEGANAGGTDAFVSKYNTDGNLDWTRQLGSFGDDASLDVAADNLGNIFITGYTNGTLDGTNAGGADAFLSKYDTEGNLNWTRQFGISNRDYGTGLAADGLGNIFITGFTGGSLGGTHAGKDDAYASKYDVNGNLVWTLQFGTPEGDHSRAISLDGRGNVFLSGETEGAFNGTNAGSGDAFIVKINDPTFVPEPSSALLLLTSLAALLSRQRF